MHVDPTQPPWPPDWTGTAPVPIGVDEAFNGYLAASVIFGLERLGVLAALAGHDSIDVAEFAGSRRLDPRLFTEVLRAAQACGYLVLRDGICTLTAAGKSMLPMRGYFTWQVGGYHELFANLARLTKGTLEFGTTAFRDEAMVAVGSASNDRELMADIVNGVFDELEFSMLADLGSGTSARVSRIVGARPGTRGLGLDISAPATELAEKLIGEAGLTDRVRARQLDVLDLLGDPNSRAELAEVDTVMSFFLMHDLLADPASRSRVLPGLREAFPAAHTFVLTDTMLRPTDGTEPTLPMFSVGYELAHALMGVPLHDRETYERLFAAADLRIDRIVPCGTPHSWLYVLRAG